MLELQNKIMKNLTARRGDSMRNKEEQLKAIKQFSSISISQICKDLNIDRSNVLSGRASKATTELLYNELKARIDKAFKK